MRTKSKVVGENCSNRSHVGGAYLWFENPEGLFLQPLPCRPNGRFRAFRGFKGDKGRGRSKNREKLYFYAKSDNDNADERMEVDFLVAKNGVGRRHNISAIEVKKTKRIAFSSLTKFKTKFASELATSYVVHTGAYEKDEDPLRLPVYLLPFVL